MPDSLYDKRTNGNGEAELSMRVGAHPRILFISSNDTPWGGSEELWARAALTLLNSGAIVSVAKPNIDWKAPPLRALAERGVKIADVARFAFVPSFLTAFVHRLSPPLSFILRMIAIWWQVKRTRPDLVILSQGINWDGYRIGSLFHRLGIPYALICQKATELYWPFDYALEDVRDFALNARHIFFVSRHNHRLFEEQIGEDITNATVVRNPFLVDYAAPLPWPEQSDPVRLACVGRLYAVEKGQDMLLRVMALPKWRERNVTVDFYGSGPNAQSLQEMARYLGCTNIRFCGQIDDMEAMWRSHHGLILPSRAEGLPLVLVEAMLAGRVAIVSKAGGSAEVVDDGETGFLMAGQDEDGLDDALERAWQRRAQWQDIGAAAATAIRTSVPPDPAGDMAARILDIASTIVNSRQE